MRKARRLTILIILLPLLAMALGSIMYLSKVKRQASERLPGIIKEAASERINGDLTIGKINILSSSIDLRDITVSDKTGKPVVRIPRVSVSYSLIDLALRQAQPLESIRRVDIFKPEISLSRSADGIWNFAQLLKPSRPAKPVKLRAKVYVKSGQMTVRDNLNLSTPRISVLKDINAWADLARKPAAVYRVSGTGLPGRMGRIKAEGEYNFDSHSFTAFLDLSGVSAPYWSNYPWHTGLKVLSGTAHANAELSKPGESKPLQYTATIKLNPSSLLFPKIRKPIQDITGDIYVNDGLINMKLKAMLGSTPMIISGNVIRHPSTQMALELSSDKANLRELAKLSSSADVFGKAVLPTSGRIDAIIFGPPKSRAVGFTLEAPTIAYGKLEGRSVIVKGVYFNKHITVRSASARAGQGLIEASGDIDLAKQPTGELDGRVSGLRLDQMPSLRKYRLATSANGSFQVSWKPGKADVLYKGELAGGSFQGLKFDRCDVVAEYADGTLHIRELGAKTLGGNLAVSGDVNSDDTLNLQVAGSDINLASVGKLYWKTPMVGRAQFVGEITGPVESPVFKGDVEAYQTMVGGLGIERAAGSITASRKAIDLDELTIYDPPGTVSISGRVSNPFSNSPSVNLALDADSMNAGRITQALGLHALTGGRLSGNLTVSGDLHHPVADAHIRIEGGAYYDIALDALEAQVSYRGSRLKLDRFIVQSGRSILTASGEATDDQIAGTFSGSELALEKFSRLLYPYAFISGNAEVSGSIGGTLDAPQAALEIKCDNPTINSQGFKEFHGKASWKDDIAVLSDLSLTDSGAGYMIPELSYNSATGTIGLSAKVQDGDAGKMLAILDSSPIVRQSPVGVNAGLNRFLARIPKPFAGKMNGGISGSVQLTDKGMDPNLKVQVNMTDMISGSSTIKIMRLEGTWRNDVVKLERLEAMDGDTNVFVEGSFGPSDALVLQADAHNLSMNTLRQWVKLPSDFSGNADITVVAGGSTHAPVSEMSIEIVDPMISGAKFDRLRCRLSTNSLLPSQSDITRSASGRIDVDDLTLMLGAHDLRASGYIPVDWREFSIPNDGSILLHSNLDSDSLVILSAFSGTVMETGEAGSFEGAVGIEGTVQSPKLQGSLTWRDGSIRIPRVNSAFEKIDARILLGDNKLSIEKFNGVSSEGGGFDVSGSIALADMKPSLNLTLKTNSLRISGKNITDIYGEDVKAAIDGELKLAGDWRSPLISGNVSIADGLIALSGKIKKPGERAWPLGINPKFNIEASLARNLQIKSARMKSPLFGKLTVQGDLSKPIVEGSIDISDGTIIMPMREFKILPGSTMALHIGSTQLPTVYLDIRAQTRLTTVSFLRQRKRYTVTMTAQGPLDKLTTTFSSSPPGLSEQTIIAMVTGQQQLEQIFARDNTNDIGKELSGLFSTTMVPSVFEPIERAFEDTLGFDEFALDIGYREPLQLTVGKHLWGKFYFDYTTALGARPDYADAMYELKLSYRLKPSLELNVITDENHIFSAGIEGILRF